jgi:hypothetical protein
MQGNIPISTNMLDVVVSIYNLSNIEGGDRRIMVPR